jgi:hypothetical protein
MTVAKDRTGDSIEPVPDAHAEFRVLLRGLALSAAELRHLELLIRGAVLQELAKVDNQGALRLVPEPGRATRALLSSLPSGATRGFVLQGD